MWLENKRSDDGNAIVRRLRPLQLGSQDLCDPRISEAAELTDAPIAARFLARLAGLIIAQRAGEGILARLRW